MAGRTHGIHAEPITFGLKLAGWYAEIGRDLKRLRTARAEIAFGKLSGAVGTYANNGSRHRGGGAGKARPAPETVATQVVPRDRHAAVLLRRWRSSRAPSSASQPRSATCSAPRSGGPRALRQGPEGLFGDAAQAQPHSHREPLRASAPGAFARRRCAREHRALARARHQPFVGRARDRARTRRSRWTSCSRAWPASSRDSRVRPERMLANLEMHAEGVSPPSACC